MLLLDQRAIACNAKMSSLGVFLGVGDPWIGSNQGHSVLISNLLHFNSLKLFSD